MRSLLALVLVGGTGRAAGAGAVTFATLGDWGGATLGGYHKDNAVAVAKRLGEAAAAQGARFVINTGDNFYYCGVMNITDEQFESDFEGIYTAESLVIPWYGVLGNHDYAYNVESQLQYRSPRGDRWQMPARYYSKRVALSDSQHATFVFLDTNPCVQAYRADNPKGWDPCSGEFGDECKVDGTCSFHAHVLSQDCGAQFSWLKSTLAAVDENDWIIAVGHHPAQEINVEDFAGTMLAGNVRLYLNGHTHELRHYRLDGEIGTDFVTSGAGCMVHTKDQADTPLACNGHSVETVFEQRASGFTMHEFASDFSSLTTKFIDADGSVAHSFVTAKSPPAPGPAPRPSPGPAPSPGPGGVACRVFGCGRYHRGQVCQCNRSCKHYKNCCKDYASVCGNSTAVVV